MQSSLLKLFLHIQFCNILPALCLYFLAKKTGYSRKIQPGQLNSSSCRAKLLLQCWYYCKQEFITKISHSTQPITHRARAVSYELRYRQISQFSREYILLYITGTYAKYGMCIYDGWLVGQTCSLSKLDICFSFLMIYYTAKTNLFVVHG